MLELLLMLFGWLSPESRLAASRSDADSLAGPTTARVQPLNADGMPTPPR
jgi:hypothetical protein